ncbi:retropepsin-like aspartic protease [Psychroflexus maritimus]|uniref:Clan AA aspartic protease n=1 Tax=Psychroflexus maritimus TaxID=2714865 RepID=A0A967AEV6_9FLAO|nr:retropepsin-like aspartic protease [Psychroflexus maritimus]NGZ89221.1 clan AA aspartic protease [Psychroflexus maritimus]
MSPYNSKYLAKNYSSTSFVITPTKHLQLFAEINGVEGEFILDTGASSSCIDFKYADFFNLQVEESEIRAAGAGASNMLTKASEANELKIGNWEEKSMPLVLFDLNHINQALLDHDASIVHGIIGADVLIKSKAILDYHKKMLFLKNKKSIIL